MVGVRPIRDEESYSAALEDIERFFDDEPEPGTPEADEFAVKLDLIAAYEARRWPIETNDPVATLVETMRLTGRSQADLAALLGSRSRASELLNRKRHLTLQQVYTISRAWGLPADALVAPYELAD
jgi:HTH-type transcriptional regulator/antitoxin HigA